MVIPLLYLQFTLKGELGTHSDSTVHQHDYPQTHSYVHHGPIKGAKTIFFLGIGGLMSVPVFKTVTHLPPYLGMLLALGVLWVVSELINPHMDEAEKRPYTAAGALTRIDVPSVLFFLGILLAVSALESMEILHHFATWLDSTLGDQRIIVTLIGILSAIVDNVPLVAASMGMYDMNIFYQDHLIWEYMAYCAGTGGSILVIGSAAGVAAMGMEKIDFIWYLKKISLLALLGYFAGAVVYLIIQPYLAVHPPH
jgi:Na+/H+ antiporter NhaD/arsenite permease-like protein